MKLEQKQSNGSFLTALLHSYCPYFGISDFLNPKNGPQHPQKPYYGLTRIKPYLADAADSVPDLRILPDRVCGCADSRPCALDAVRDRIRDARIRAGRGQVERPWDLWVRTTGSAPHTPLLATEHGQKKRSLEHGFSKSHQDSEGEHDPWVV